MLRARALVINRDPDAINAGGLVVHWMLNEALPELRAKHPGIDAAQPNQPEPPLNTLVRVRKAFPIGGMVYFPEATWAQLFASYAIRAIQQAHVALQDKRELLEAASSPDLELMHSLDRSFLCDLLEATAAVHLAERLQDVREDVQAEEKLMLTEQQRERGIKRHVKTDALQTAFLKFYIKGGGRNKTQAARDFLAQLDAGDRAKFTREDENAITTLTRGLRQRLSEHDEPES